MTESRAIPKATLAYLFPQGFVEFWQKTGMKDALEQIIYAYVPATLEREEIKKTLASGGYGWSAVAIAGHFTERYWYSQFEPWPDDFVAKFKTNLIFVISDIRRKEHLWSQVYREFDKLLKPLKLKTDTRTSQNYDKTQQIGGKTVNTGNENQQWSEQKQTNQKNTPSFSKVDLNSGEYGGFSRQNQLSTQTNEQNQGSRSREHKHTTDKINHVNKEFYRASKEANVNTTTQDAYEWASVARLLNNWTFTLIDFTQYYKLFDKLMIKLFGMSVVPVIDPVTGRRKYVPQHDYEEIREEGAGRPIIPEGNEWDESLPYLERLKIILSKTEKEHQKLIDTSNRKPRIALRLKNLEGCLKAYEPEYIELPTLELFRQRINGEVEGYQKVIGYRNIIEVVEKYLRSYHFAKRNNTKPPAQLMIMLLGEPGLGKTYISMAIARALGRGCHTVGMNGKLNASLITGTNIENPGAEPGEILKAISRYEDRGVVIVFDEIEKAARECKEAVGIPTDITSNKGYRDTFLDFPTPTNECIFFATVNRPQDVPQFVADRFAIRVEVLPLPYAERLEVVRVVLQGELKDLNNAFRRIYSKSWEEIYALFNQEELLKKTLTWTFSIRGAKNNILLKLIPTLISDFLEPETALPNEEEVVNYNWGFFQREGKDETCPYAQDARNIHKTNCMCFTQNLDKAPGWAENMGTEYQGGLS